MPHREPFLFLQDVTLDGEHALGDYKITGNEYFLEVISRNNRISRLNHDRGIGPIVRLFSVTRITHWYIPKD